MNPAQLSFLEDPQKNGESEKPRRPGLEPRIAELEALQLNWEAVAKIALPRFPELGPGEKIGRREVEGRISRLRSAGYPVRPYQEIKVMSLGEMLKYFLHVIRPEVYRMAGRYCKKTVEEIDERNKKIKEGAYLLR